VLATDADLVRDGIDELALAKAAALARPERGLRHRPPIQARRVVLGARDCFLPRAVAPVALVRACED
jgi:hypothetical protein